MTTTASLKKVKCDFSNRDLYNRAYLPLFNDKSEFLHLFGSAGSGKSRFEAQKEIALSFAWNRRHRKSLIIRKIGNTLKDSVYTELLTVIAEWNLMPYFEILKSPLGIRNKMTNVQFIFKGLDDPEKIKSISKVDRAWIEEATELETRSELDQLRLRLRGFSEVQVTLSYNPIDEHHWLNTEIHQQMPPEHRIFKTTYRDNEKMLAKDPNYAPSIERLQFTNENYYRVYGLGLWGKVVEGLIYNDFDSTKDIIPEFPKDENGRDDIHFYGLDFGFSDPTALVAQHIQDALPKKNLINKQILYKSGIDPVNLVKEFDALEVRKDIKIIADSAQPGMIKALADAGYKIEPCEKGAGSILIGINSLRRYTLKFVAGSRELIKEIQNYQKNEISGKWMEEPKKNQVDHGLDAIRYGEQAANQPVYERQEPDSTSEEIYW